MSFNMASLPARDAVFEPLPPIPAHAGNRRTIVLNWRQDAGAGAAAATCEVCDERIISSSIQCDDCDARICVECTEVSSDLSRSCAYPS